MENRYNEEDEYEKNRRLGRIILIGIFTAFVSSVVMCIISLVLLVRTVSLANRVNDRNEELNKRYELLDERISDAEQTIAAAEENIEKNTKILTTTIDGQTQFVDELYKNMSDRAVAMKDEEDKKSEEDIKTDEGTKGKENTKSEEASTVSNTYDELLNTEMKILLEMLNALDKY